MFTPKIFYLEKCDVYHFKSIYFRKIKHKIKLEFEVLRTQIFSVTIWY